MLHVTMYHIIRHLIAMSQGVGVRTDNEPDLAVGDCITHDDADRKGQQFPTRVWTLATWNLPMLTRPRQVDTLT